MHSMESFFTIKDQQIFLHLFIKPNAKENSIIGPYDNKLKMTIKSAPQNNEANTEVIAFLADVLAYPKSKIKISSGHKSHYKSVVINLKDDPAFAQNFPRLCSFFSQFILSTPT